MTEDANKVDVRRLTVATAADLLRDYEQELERAGVDGEYTREVSEMVEKLDSALGNSPSEGRANADER